MGDAIETITGYSNIIKNATGVIGIIVVLSICIKPTMELLSFTLIYHFGTALLQPVADEKVVGILEIMADTFKILLGIMVTVSVILIMGLAIVIRIST